MKLNHECVRDVLLHIEETAPLDDYLFEKDLLSAPSLKDYEKDELYYTCIKLKEAGLINGDIMNLPDYKTLVISSLTFEGHSFLDNIRDDGVWKKTKEKINSSVTSVSISVAGQIAGSIIKRIMGLN